MNKDNDKKYNTFHDFILKDDRVVMKTLIVISMWTGNILFTLLILALWISRVYEIAIILGIINLFGWWKVIKFYRLGGLKAMPAMTAEQIVWNKKKKDP